jgi:hypothetical protein
LGLDLAGTIDENLFNNKSAELKTQAEDVARQLDEDNHFDAAQAQMALNVFDFSQNLVDIWRGSNFAVRRQILDCVSSNRTLSDVSLCLEKRRPFDFLVERPFLKNGRGDWRSFEPCPQSIAPYPPMFIGPPEPFIITVQHLVRLCA